MDSYRRLLRHHRAGILTVQLPFDPADAARRGFEARLTDARHEAEATREANLSPDALDRAFRFIKERIDDLEQPPARSVLYLATPDGLLDVRYSPLDLPLLGRFAQEAAVGGFILADSARPRGVGVLTTDADALLFDVDPGRANIGRRLDDLVPAHQAAGGWSQARYQRHRNQHAQEHMREVATAIERTLEEGPARWLVVAGPAEARAALERALSEAAITRLAGHFRGEFHEPLEALEARAMEVLLTAQESANTAEIQRLVDAEAAGARGATGWQTVLPALAEHAVQTLYCPAKAAALDASRDAEGYLSAVPVGEPSWITGAATLRAAELPEAAVIDAVRSGADVYGVRGTAAALLEAHGSVVAALRHR